jgi:bifunctional DNA primase/polymerase-like protein/AAA domain-containing protein/primase-like protein
MSIRPGPHSLPLSCRYALWYARHRGWPVFPLHGIRDGRCTCADPKCDSPGKHPRTEHGVKDATSDTGTIQRWWAQWPDANIGGTTGGTSGVDVLDVDPRHYGDETLRELERKHEELPKTVLSLTGGGGCHVFFRHIPGLKNSNGEIGEGIDLKTDGGYVVLPPSRHFSGRQYAWEGASRPDEVSPAPFPEWLLSIASGTKGNGHHVPIPPVTEKIPKGRRNHELTSLAGSMRRRGMDAEEISAALAAVNKRRCDPPLSDAEVRAIGESIARYKPAAGPAAEDPPDFPDAPTPEEPPGEKRQQSGPRIRSIEQVPLMSDCEARDINYLEEPVLVEGAVTAFTGDAGCGKSSLACAVARRAHAAGRPVLILDRENPLAVVKDRFRRLDMSDNETLRVWGGWVGEEAPQPASAIVMQWVLTCSPKPVIVVDSMSAFHGGDENSAGETRAFLHQLRQLADLGATPLLIHHDGKAESAKDYRGSSDFKAAVDIAFHITNFDDDGRLNKLVLRCYKSRFGFAGQVAYEYAGGKLFRDDEAEVRQTVSEQLTVILRLNPGVSVKRFGDLAMQRGLGRNQALRFLSAGVLAGTIRRETSPNNEKRHFLIAIGESAQ